MTNANLHVWASPPRRISACTKMSSSGDKHKEFKLNVEKEPPDGYASENKPNKAVNQDVNSTKDLILAQSCCRQVSIIGYLLCKI